MRANRDGEAWVRCQRGSPRGPRHGHAAAALDLVARAAATRRLERLLEPRWRDAHAPGERYHPAPIRCPPRAPVKRSFSHAPSRASAIRSTTMVPPAGHPRPNPIAHHEPPVMRSFTFRPFRAAPRWRDDHAPGDQYHPGPNPVGDLLSTENAAAGPSALERSLLSGRDGVGWRWQRRHVRRCARRRTDYERDRGVGCWMRRHHHRERVVGCGRPRARHARYTGRRHHSGSCSAGRLVREPRAGSLA